MFTYDIKKTKKNKIIIMKHLKKYEGYTYYNDKLNSKFWTNEELDERIRKKLLSIANDFYQETKLTLEIKDITLTGSLCNYNYNEYSDFDVHIIVDYSELEGDEKIISDAINSHRITWNLKHNIKIQGHDVEVYIQDFNDEARTESGLYSLLRGEWIKKPVHNTPEIDEEEIEFKFANYKSGINRLVELSDMNMTTDLARHYYNVSKDLKKKIHGQRKTDLLTDKAEFSVGNLVFKRLRNSGHFGLLIDVVNKFYDKIYAQ